MSIYPSEADIDMALAEFGGDARATIRALLSDLATLADDRDENVSTGFVRGRRYHLIGRP
jgi:hypothetical protein